ncbi:MAG TPA: luciferase family protein [Nitrososphaeraceae archaeon]
MDYCYRREKNTTRYTQMACVTAEPHHFGGVEFRLNKKELGHMHSDRLVDLPFPMKIRD